MARVSNPLISIVIPVYNVEKYLSRCIDSVINQTYKNIEIILVDDDSPDNCPKICDDYAKKDKRIKVFHKENGGVSFARNIGINESKGEWITFIDSDDWVEKDYCETMLKIAQKNNADYVCCGYNRVYNDHKEIINGDESIKKYNNEEYLLKLLNVQNSYGFCHMKLIKKQNLNKVTFDENIQVGEDALFNASLCQNLSNVIVINKPLYNYNFNSQSVVRKFDKNYVNKYLDSMISMKEYINKNYSNDKVVLQHLYNYVSYHVLLICVNYCYHPLNKNKMKSLKKVCNIELFKKAIKKSNYNDMSITRKITLFTLKHKLYFLTALICKIRQHQFR